jgi:hypothetical protein
MPMLDEQEFAEIVPLHRSGMQSYGAPEAPIESIPRTIRFEAMLNRYEAITGHKETNPNAVWHHRLSLYGPPSERCGRPLRSPMAKGCGSCMAPRSST